MQGGAYLIQNNEWGADDGQCVTANSGPGFTVDSGNHNKSDSPAAYPSIMSGCWMGTCTKGTTLPVQIGQLGPITSSITASIPEGVKSNLAYDIWADSTPKKTGQNDAMELMIWLKDTGGITPIGAKAGTASIGGAIWDVWKGNNDGVNVISYLRHDYVESAANLPITDFVRDAVKQGSVKESDYLTNIQAGFEPWTGGAGLQLTEFSVATKIPQTNGTASTASSSTTIPPATSGSAADRPPRPEPTLSTQKAPTVSSTTETAPAPTSPTAPSAKKRATMSSNDAGGLEKPSAAPWALSSGLAGFQSTPWNNENATDPMNVGSPNVPGREAVKFSVPGGGKRSEAQPNNSTFSPGDHKFFGYSAYLDKNFVTGAKSWQVIWQLHDGGTNGSPPLALEIGSGRLWLATSGNDRDKDLGAVQPGENVAVQMEVEFARGGGVVSVWRDGKQVLAGYTPPRGTMVDGSDYLKTGIYRDPSENQPSTLYLNDLKIGDSFGSVDDLAGQVESTPVETAAAPGPAPAAGAVLVLTPLLSPSRRRRRRTDHDAAVPERRPARGPLNLVRLGRAAGARCPTEWTHGPGTGPPASPIPCLRDRDP